MKIALHQMCSGIDPQDNAAAMVKAIHEAALQNAVFYFAPEMSLLLDRDRSRAAHNVVQEEESAALVAIKEAAAAAQIWVHLGSMAVRTGPDAALYANRSLVIDDKGAVRARYDKIHLFDVDLPSGESWRESNAYRPGTEAVILDCPLGSMGLSICYDMRFPDLYSVLAKAAVDVICVPAAFTVPTGRAHWHTLLRARAIEAEAFVIAAGQSGTHADGRETYGHSLVVDPWGEIVLDMGEGEGLAVVDLDLTRIQEVRTQIPVHANRRDVRGAVRYT
jgi:deaminated glutathione amidase